MALECLTELCSDVESGIKDQYLAKPTGTDIDRTERQFAEEGFIGHIGCLDCIG